MTHQRNRSFTKEEINAYWQTRKKIEEEHLKAISGSSHRSQVFSPVIARFVFRPKYHLENIMYLLQESIGEEESPGLQVFERWSSMPLFDTKGAFMKNFTQTETETNLEKFLLKNGW